MFPIISNSSYSKELVDAYVYAYQIGITTVNNINKAQLTSPLLRKHLAKMISNYAMNVLKKVPDTSRSCTFGDMAKESAEMISYSKLACQLGLMGVNAEGKSTNKFTPNEEVNRAQFGTVLSRALWGEKYNGGTNFYSKHLTALKAKGIMTKITEPEGIKEIRGYVMLMMMRAVK